MLVMSKGALSAKQAESYYEEKYSQDDYYTEERRVVGRWFGKERRPSDCWRSYDRRISRCLAWPESGEQGKCWSNRQVAMTTDAPDGMRPSTRPNP